MKPLFIILAALFSCTSFAQTTAQHPCRQDVQRFCKGVKRGHGAIMQCLMNHEDELSQECRAKRAAMKEKHKAHKEACKGDVEKFCKDVKPGGGAIRDCLKNHQSELSTGCTLPKGL